MSRTLAHLAELQPAMFCEVSPELARERGLQHGGWATISTARTAIEARVLVTDRVTPLRVAGSHRAPGRAAVSLGDTRPHDRRRRQRPVPARARSERAHPRGEGRDVRHPARPAAARPRADDSEALSATGGRRSTTRSGLLHRHDVVHRVQGVRGRVQGVERRPRRTGSTSSACPTTTPASSARDTWRHVAFIEQRRPRRRRRRSRACAG